MSAIQKLLGSAVIMSCLLGGFVQAAVQYPMLEVSQLSGDAGIISNGGALTIDATVPVILTSSTSFVDINDLNFMLTGTMVSQDSQSITYGSGTIQVGNGTDTYFSANFDSLVFSPITNTVGTFAADLTNVSGSLAAGSVARIEGGYQNVTSTILDANPSVLSGDFQAQLVSAKVGPVQAVPLPAAATLFLSGLCGLFGVGRLKRTAR